jgi:cyclin T
LVQKKAIYVRVVSTDISAYYCLLQEIYDKQKELILLGERVVLVTLGFDLNIHHAYRPLVEAIRRFNIDNKSPLAQVAWNFVNDGYASATLAVFF